MGAGLMQAQTVSTLYNFDGTHGSNPTYMQLAQGQDGKLYGATYYGGSTGNGEVFSIDTTGNVSVIYNFTGGADGGNPIGGPVLGTDGNLYGATNQGGSNANGFQGVFYKLTTAGVETVLHTFSAGIDGAFPWAAPILASDGNFYGTTTGGGTTGNGILYKISTTGTFTNLYSFDYANGGAYPTGSVLQASDGNLYMTASIGGANNCGTALETTTAGVVKKTFSFNCGSGGAYPIGGLIQAADGALYGTTDSGGTYGYGTLFKLSRTAFVQSILHNFLLGDGEYPDAAVYQATDKKLYAPTSEGGTYGDGILFDSTTKPVYKNIYSFNNSVNLESAAPVGQLMQHTNGTLYGVAQFGGTNDLGTVYSVANGMSAFCALVQPVLKVGNTLEILGQGMTGTTSVTVNGISATFKVKSDTYVTATVPAGATTGPVVVTTPSGTLTSNRNFTLKQ
jgi:uncharacterized repeat protein (TIGR03803 family)